MKIITPTIILAMPLMFAGAVMSAGPGHAKTSKVSYKQVQSLLDSQCLPCHSAKSHAAKIDLHAYAAVMASSVVVKGKPDQSRLLQYVNGSKKPMMPMGKKALTADQVNTIKNWIAQGAPSK